MVVPDAHVAVARAVAKQIAAPGEAASMWTVGLNALGTGLPTHWASSGMIHTQFANLLGDAAGTFNAYQAAGGVTVTLAQIQAMFLAAPLGTHIRSDVQGSEQAAIAALGLKFTPG